MYSWSGAFEAPAGTEIPDAVFGYSVCAVCSDRVLHGRAFVLVVTHGWLGSRAPGFLRNRDQLPLILQGRSLGDYTVNMSSVTATVRWWEWYVDVRDEDDE